jgi:hypothetical protein
VERKTHPPFEDLVLTHILECVLAWTRGSELLF